MYALSAGRTESCLLDEKPVRLAVYRPHLAAAEDNPIISFCGPMSVEGDLLWFLKDRNFPDLKLLEDMPITSIERRRDNKAVKIDESMENLFDKVMNQNFVPVVDDKKVFIGIVTRKDVLAYLGKKAAAQA